MHSSRRRRTGTCSAASTFRRAATPARRSSPARSTWAASRSGRISSTSRRATWRPATGSTAPPSATGLRHRRQCRAGARRRQRSSRRGAARRRRTRRRAPSRARRPATCPLPLPYAIPAPSAPRTRRVKQPKRSRRTPCGARTTSIYVYYRVAADSAGARNGSPRCSPTSRREPAFADRCSRGATIRRPGWRSTRRSRAPQRSGASSTSLAQEHEAAALDDGRQRHVEASRRCPRCRRDAAAAKRDLRTAYRAMCLALIALDAHPRYRWSSPPIATSITRAPRRPRMVGRGLPRRTRSQGGRHVARRRRARPLRASHQRARACAPRSARAFARRAGAATCSPQTRRRSVSLPAQVRAGARYNGFNLVAGDARELLWGSNRRRRRSRMRSAPESTAFRITCSTRRGRRWCARRQRSTLVRRRCATRTIPPRSSRCLPIRERAPDDELPATGVTLERERLLSSPFIVSADYGTRCSTVLTIDRDGQRAASSSAAFDPAGSATGEVEFRFALTRKQYA